MRTMAFKVVDRLFIVVYGAANPSNEEWRDYLEEVRRHGIDRTVQLISTDGGRPTSSQRAELDQLLARRPVPVAVCTGSARVRTLVTAMSWFNRLIRAFPANGIRDAVDYLELPTSRTQLVVREIGKLRLELGLDRRATA